MPVIPVDYEEIVRLIGRRIPRQELVERVPMMGGAFDGEQDGKLLFEFFPNRPDLLSVEGLARACRAFFEVQPGLVHYPVDSTGEQVQVEPSVTKIRPVIGFARVEGLELTDERLAELIDVQERLTTGPGRRRRKVAIGIHDAAPVRGPFTYKAVKPDEVRFVPLQMERELTAAQILDQHDKGRLYRHLVEGHAKVPLIVDRDGQVLSMPPVINGQLTALTTRTQDVIVDVTGTEQRAVMGILNIVASSLAERGGRIKAFQMVRGKVVRTTPDLTPGEMTLPYARVKTLLGLDLEPHEVGACLGRMGHGFEAGSTRSGRVLTPAWRFDVLHADDMVEDVAIGYGFDRFKPRLPAAAHFGGIHPDARTHRRARTALLGLGFTEVVTLTLTGKPDAFDRIGAGPAPVVEVSNALTVDHAILRPQIFTNLLGILRANKRRELPQSVFEVGYVVPPGPEAKTQLRAAGVRIASRAGFAECKGVVEAFMRDAGRPAAVKAGDAPGFVPGRCATLEHEGAAVGFFGEIHPSTLEAFELAAPAYAFEVVL